MEELALKPLGEIPKDVNYSALESNYITRSVTTYNYGEDIAKWGAIQPFTNNHVTQGSLLNMFDADSTTYFELQDSGAGTQTTTIILDFGKLLEIRGVFVSAGLVLDSLGGGSQTLTTSFSLDGSNYTQIDTDTNSTVPGEVKVDHLSATRYIRTLKLVISTNAVGPANDERVRIYQVMVIV